MTLPSSIEINDRFREALAWMEGSDRSVFITGKAGTGKSTLLEYFRESTGKRLAVLAPTGVAALNVRGQTIHSFCGFKPDVTLDKVKKINAKRFPERAALFKRLEAVVIDEASMMRADLLDCVEKFLRLNGPKSRKPFGGLQMIFIGDLYQLPPVVTRGEKQLFILHYETPYFFSAHCLLKDSFRLEFVELEKIYRQTEADFIGLLNAVRNRSVTADDLDRLNTRFDPEFIPPEDDFYITLTSTNDLAAARNREKLDRLPGRSYAYEGLIDGEFERSSLPTDERLELKVGAQVMLLNNDPGGRWVNGTIGRVTGVLHDKGEDDRIVVELADGGEVEVKPNIWELFRFSLDSEEKAIVSEAVGAFTQYPLRLAWAVTIHKSQGKTFPKVVVDIGRGTFAHGQVYVALSRCTSFGGLVLKTPIGKSHILTDWRVSRFLTRFQYDRAEERLSYNEKKRLVLEAVADNRDIEIVYLKPDDTKSRRRIRPESVEEMEYAGKSFEGVRAYCREREEMRTFRIDRMLEIKPL
ncbi:MAG: AAA family ATPase [Candidatus Aminicenantes bacterium]|nr:AAA family ATPase [Candidatus Aminicenantes bacterium]